MSTVKITNTEFVRDMSSQAVLNTDISGLHQYERTRQKLKSERQDRLNTKERLQQLEARMAELQTMITELHALKDSNGHS